MLVDFCQSSSLSLWWFNFFSNALIMFDSKKHFCLKNILLTALVMVVGFFGGHSAQASEVGTQLRGFPGAEYELMINPCVSTHALHRKYGERAVNLAKKILKGYPVGMCDSPEVVAMLSEWNSNASALLASTDRPFIIEPMIKEYNRLIRDCSAVSCLERYLPRVLEWSRVTLNRTPIAPEEVHTLSMTSSPIAHPQLALRDFPLPLSRQQEICGSTSIDALKFASSSIIIAGRAVAFVTCKKPEQKVAWLVEQRDAGQKWREILVLPGTNDISVLPQNKEVYPNIFYETPTADGRKITLLEFSEDSGYKEKLSFDVVPDGRGVNHAFKVKYHGAIRLSSDYYQPD